jgi:ABC-2 type transport system permease protein
VKESGRGSVMKYLRLYAHFVRNSIIAQMEFKANFILSICTELGFIFAKSLYIIVLFSAGLDIYGMSPEKMLMFIGSYTFITGIMDAVYYPNIAAIPEYVRMANLDMYLTKPINSLFLISFRKFDLGLGIPNVLAGIIMIVVSWNMCGLPLNISCIMGFVFWCIIGCVLTYPILLIPVLLSFWTVKSDSLMDVVWSLWDFNNMPMTIYNRFLRLLGVFIIPIFVITNFAPMYVFGILPFSYGVYGIIAIPIFLLIAVMIWKKALRHYSSASS